MMPALLRAQKLQEVGAHLHYFREHWANTRQPLKPGTDYASPTTTTCYKSCLYPVESGTVSGHVSFSTLSQVPYFFDQML